MHGMSNPCHQSGDTGTAVYHYTVICSVIYMSGGVSPRRQSAASRPSAVPVSEPAASRPSAVPVSDPAVPLRCLSQSQRPAVPLRRLFQSQWSAVRLLLLSQSQLSICGACLRGAAPWPACRPVLFYWRLSAGPTASRAAWPVTPTDMSAYLR